MDMNVANVIPEAELEHRLAAAVERLFELITASELSRRLSTTPDPLTGRIRRITPQGVSKWARSQRIPHDRCLTIEVIVDGALSRHDMRPDVFGPQPQARVA